MNKTSTIIATLVGLATLISAGWALDKKWDQKESVIYLSKRMAYVETRFENKIVSDQLAAIQKRLWTLKDRHGEDVSKFPPTAKEEYRSLDNKKGILEKDLERIKNEQLEINKERN